MVAKNRYLHGKGLGVHLVPFLTSLYSKNMHDASEQSSQHLRTLKPLEINIRILSQSGTFNGKSGFSLRCKVIYSVAHYLRRRSALGNNELCARFSDKLGIIRLSHKHPLYFSDKMAEAAG